LVLFINIPCLMFSSWQLISSPVLAKLGASTPIWGSLQDNSKFWYFTLSKVKEVHQISAWVFYLSTIKDKEALTTDSWGLCHHWEVGMNVRRQGKARPGQAGSSGDGLKEQHKHAREHRTKISWTKQKRNNIISRVLSSFGSNVHEERKDRSKGMI
jgi:hypothetical protein